MANKITYYFDSKSMRHIFESCISVIEDELSMSRLMELNEICTISEEEHSEDLFQDDEILIDESNINQCVSFFVELFGIDARSLFMHDEYIKKRYEEILLSDEGHDSVLNFTIRYRKNSRLNHLFNVIYARMINSEWIETTEGDFNQVLTFNDFDHESFDEAIVYLKPDQIPDVIFNHLSTEIHEDIEFVKINYMMIKKGCTYCQCSKEHAKKHGNETEYVLCLPHRMISTFVINSYNDESVSYRNPKTHSIYALIPSYDSNNNEFMHSNNNEIELVPKIPKIPKKIFLEESTIISMTPPVFLNTERDNENGWFFPCVIANVNNNEYVNRSFAIVFNINNEWGILKENVLNFFKFIGFNSLTHFFVNTNTNGMRKSIRENDKKLEAIISSYKFDTFKQRTMCNECI